MSNPNSVYSIVKGLSENECKFIGRVAETPYVAADVAIIKLNTVAAEMDTNGQLVDRIQVVPITVLDKKKIAGIKQFVKKGKQLSVTTFYKSWQDNGQDLHALVATKIKYGPDEYKGEQQKRGGGGSPAGFPNIPPAA